MLLDVWSNCCCISKCIKHRKNCCVTFLCLINLWKERKKFLNWPSWHGFQKGIKSYIKCWYSLWCYRWMKSHNVRARLINHVLLARFWLLYCLSFIREQAGIFMFCYFSTFVWHYYWVMACCHWCIWVLITILSIRSCFLIGALCDLLTVMVQKLLSQTCRSIPYS